MLIPVKAFTAAKARLAGALDPTSRAGLARAMAESVVAAAAPLPVWVVCDDEDVAAWALGRGAQVEWTPGLGLNGAVQEAVARRERAGFTRVVVAHADLPFATDLAGLAPLQRDRRLVRLVADRRGEGTNVISLPTGTDFRFAYGAGSFERHVAEVQRCGLSLRVERIDALAWDVDEPADLDPPATLGALSCTPDITPTTSKER